jgi:hypothetical protein
MMTASAISVQVAVHAERLDAGLRAIQEVVEETGARLCAEIARRAAREEMFAADLDYPLDSAPEGWR